jgi:hypothetical protein
MDEEISLDEPIFQKPSKSVKSLNEILAAKSLSKMNNNNLNMNNPSFHPPPPPRPQPVYQTEDEEQEISDIPFPVEDNAEYDFLERDEMEMPSSSAVFHDDSDVLMLLAAGGNNSNNTNNNSSTNSKPPPPALFPKDKEDLIELYSTITLLKKENQELQKDLEFTKRSKEALLKDQQSKSDHIINRLKSDLKMLDERNSFLENEKFENSKFLEQFKEENEQLSREKDEIFAKWQKLREKELSLKSNDSNAELLSLKTENNKLKMEIGRMRADADQSASFEMNQLKDELQKRNYEMEGFNQSHELEVDSLTQTIKKLEEQVSEKRSFLWF